MAQIKEMDVSGLSGFFVKKHLRVSAAAVEVAVASGAKLEMKESGFSDPGPDYCEVLLDGKVIAHIPGY